MNACSILLMVGCLGQQAANSPAPASAPKSVVEIQNAHDRALIKALTGYATANPKADDVDQAYLTVFQRVIDHDWFAEAEPTALAYLKSFPDGGVTPMARIVATMAQPSMSDLRIS